MKVVNNTVKLCCGGKGCPEVKINSDRVEITDDYGNTIRITKEEADLIPKALVALTEEEK